MRSTEPTRHRTGRRLAGAYVVAAAVVACSPASPNEIEPVVARPKVKRLVLESWRNNDLEIWVDEILPVFEARHPGIEVHFAPTVSAEYNAEVTERLSSGIGPDLLTCRPFDESAALFEAGHLAPLDRDELSEQFDESALAAWSTPDGNTTYCVPVASVIHGFLYNVAVFDELGIDVPGTVAEFDEVLDQVERAGTVETLAIGAKAKWELATMGLQTIGPTYWSGEQGRLGLIDGTAKFTDDEFVSAFDALASWGPHLPAGAASLGESEAQQLFAGGEAAIYPAGSWELARFSAVEGLGFSAFPPPRETSSSPCFVTDHTDLAIGMNPASAHHDAALTFLRWTASEEFAELYTNALPGFFPLHRSPVEYDNAVAAEFASWRDLCETTIRSSAQFLSSGQPDLELELWDVSAAVVLGDLSPEEATATLQEGLESWYVPQQ